MADERVLKGVVAVVGATGAVGGELLAILRERGVPRALVRAFASARSEGSVIPYGRGAVKVRALSAGCFEGVSLALFAADSETAGRWAPTAVRAGAVVIDNSSHYRAAAGVPLVIPEVNGEMLASGKKRPQIIANPNCSTILMLMALEPLRRRFGVRRVQVVTYQAVSGAGAGGIAELRGQVSAWARGEKAGERRVFQEPCAFNVFSHDSRVEEEEGCNGEERKMIRESARIWGRRVPVTPTCVRVPVERAHSQAISVELGAAASVEEARAALREGAGLRVMDDRAGNAFPTPLKAACGDEVLVGRVRLDPGRRAGQDGRSRHVCLWACMDQLRKGAALNAVQIAELVGEVRREDAGYRGLLAQP